MANKHMKRGPISLIIRETQIKIAMRYYFMVTRMAIMKQKQKQKTVVLARM